MRFALLTLGLIAAASPALAQTPAHDEETTIPRMSHFLEWVPDGHVGLYIRGDTGRWYYARLREECPRLQGGARISFSTSATDTLDRYSSIRAQGWRCQIASITDSRGPPDHDRH